MKLIIYTLLLFYCGLSAAFSQQIVQQNVHFGHRKTAGRTIDVIVVHSTFNASGGDRYDKERIIAQFQRYGVVAHYLIDRQGTTYQLVNDHHVAYHAGRSQLNDGSGSLNNRSLGIELMNDTTDNPTDEQYQALTDLVDLLCSRYPVRQLVRHSDIAPGRKTDPWNTDWDKIVKLLAGRGRHF